MAEKELFGNSEQLDDTISRQAVDAIDGIAVKAEDGNPAKWRGFFHNMPRISFTDYVPERWDDEG